MALEKEKETMTTVGFDYTYYKLARSKSFDSSLSQLPSIHEHHTKRQPIKSALHRNTDNDVTSASRTDQPVVMVSRTPAHQSHDISKRRRASLKDHDLLKSMFEQLNMPSRNMQNIALRNMAPRPPDRLATQSARQRVTRARHISLDLPSKQPAAIQQQHQQPEVTIARPLLPRRSASTYNLHRTAKPRSETSSTDTTRKQMPAPVTSGESQCSQQGEGQDELQQRSTGELVDPEMSQTVDRCRLWLQSLPSKFSGMHNAVSLPAITPDYSGETSTADPRVFEYS